jgi:hypothetical protein
VIVDEIDRDYRGGLHVCFKLEEKKDPEEEVTLEEASRPDG